VSWELAVFQLPGCLHGDPNAKSASCSKSHLLIARAANCCAVHSGHAPALCSLLLPLPDESAAKIWSPWSDSPAGSQPTTERDRAWPGANSNTVNPSRCGRRLHHCKEAVAISKLPQRRAAARCGWRQKVQRVETVQYLRGRSAGRGSELATADGECYKWRGWAFSGWCVYLLCMCDALHPWADAPAGHQPCSQQGTAGLSHCPIDVSDCPLCVGCPLSRAGRASRQPL
jgi:hypothetical protein